MFADAALALLTTGMNFGHHTIENNTSSKVQCHVWYIDPYLSDADLYAMLALFPARGRLEARPTGERLSTPIERINPGGEMDEALPFYQRWCVIL